MKYKASRDLPNFIKKHKTTSPTELRNIILSERNRAVTEQSVSNWIRRNKEIVLQIENDFRDSELTKEEISKSIFNNGDFKKLRSVDTWVNEMKDRDLSPSLIKSHVNTLKRVCLGRFPRFKVDLVKEDIQPLIHPDRLTLEDAQKVIRYLKAKGKGTSTVRYAMRSFLESKGIVVGNKISGSKALGFGKHKDLFTSIENIRKILACVKQHGSYKAYVLDLFMFKTGTRITSTLEAEIDLFRLETDRTVKVVDKGRHSKGRATWLKHIDENLYIHLKNVIGDRKTGLIFEGIEQKEITKLNKNALNKVIPELVKVRNIRMWNHFFRHMFAQHMLRLTGWNYGVVASLGGWTIQALQESYGEPPQQVVKKWGLENIPLLKVS